MKKKTVNMQIQIILNAWEEVMVKFTSHIQAELTGWQRFLQKLTGA